MTKLSKTTLLLLIVGLTLVVVVCVDANKVREEDKTVIKIKNEGDSKEIRIAKRAADDGDDEAKPKSKKTKKKPKSSTTTKSPDEGSSTTSKSKSTTKMPEGSSTTPKSMSTTKMPEGSSTTPKSMSTTKMPDGSTTVNPNKSSTTTSKAGISTTKMVMRKGLPTDDDTNMTRMMKHHDEEQEMIVKAYDALVEWDHFLLDHRGKTLNKRRAMALVELVMSMSKKYRLMSDNVKPTRPPRNPSYEDIHAKNRRGIVSKSKRFKFEPLR